MPEPTIDTGLSPCGLINPGWPHTTAIASIPSIEEVEVPVPSILTLLPILYLENNGNSSGIEDEDI